MRAPEQQEEWNEENEHDSAWKYNYHLYSKLLCGYIHRLLVELEPARITTITY